MEEQILVGNYLLSEFMELKTSHGHNHPNGAGWCITEMLKYHSHWNWLMKVWIKFRELRFEGIHEQFEHSEFKQNISHKICYGTMDDAFQSIVSAIQWYNSIK